MKMQSSLLTVVVLAFWSVSSPSHAANPSLRIGDPAPKLQTGKWVQGDAVKEFDRDHVYLVEFWATWCGPCRLSIPHLNEVQGKFKDKGLIVIGQDVFERDESLVAPFVKKMGDNMTYRVALDLKTDKEDKGRMAETWMEAADQNGIPAAFLVNKEGKIAWDLVTSKGLDEPDLKLALIIAQRASAAAQGKDPQILDTVARVQFLMGKKDEAITSQTRAVELSQGKDRDQLQQTLESYKAGKVPSQE